MTQFLQTLLIVFLAVAVFAAAIAMFGGAHALVQFLRRRADAIAPGIDGQFPLLKLATPRGVVIVNPNLVPAALVSRDGELQVPDLIAAVPWLEHLMQRQQAVQLAAAATRNGSMSVDPRSFSEDAHQQALDAATRSVAQAFASAQQVPVDRLMTADPRSKRQVSAERVRKLADRINKNCYPDPPTEANASDCTGETDNGVIQAALRELEARGMVTPGSQGRAREWTQARIPALMVPA